MCAVLPSLSRRGFFCLMAPALGFMLAGPVSAQDIFGTVTCLDTDGPLEGLTVVATRSDQGDVQSTLTDSNGYYAFSISATTPQFYEVRLTNVPASLSFVSPADGIYPDVFVFPPDLPGVADFTLTGCASAPPAALGDRVWQDLDCDGIQDPGEPGLVGVTVQLTDCSGAWLAETATDAEGGYAFIGLAAGEYAVRFVAPPGYAFAPPNQGADPALDSDADPATGRTVCISLAAGQVDDSWDAGLCEREAPGVRNQGYWKNHPQAWPVEALEVGGVDYDRWEAILIMQLPVQGDKWLNLFGQQVSARLNVLSGNEAGCVADSVAAADLWLMMNPSPVPARSDAWQGDGQALHSRLEDYNTGLLCAPAAGEN